VTRIRLATPWDLEAIREVHLRAFPDGEGQMVSDLAVSLLGEKTTPETISLVAEVDGVLVGHVAFSPVTVEDREDWTGYILAPLGVVPECQKRGIGSTLVEAGTVRLMEAGVNVLFVYGDPEYYGRFGFETDLATGYAPPYELQYAFGWQAVLLNEGSPVKPPASISCVASLCDPELW
jgi:putative acetyltransferase